MKFLFDRKLGNLFTLNVKMVWHFYLSRDSQFYIFQITSYIYLLPNSTLIMVFKLNLQNGWMRKWNITEDHLCLYTSHTYEGSQYYYKFLPSDMKLETKVTFNFYYDASVTIL